MAEYCPTCHGALVGGKCLVPNCPARDRTSDQRSSNPRRAPGRGAESILKELVQQHLRRKGKGYVANKIIPPALIEEAEMLLHLAVDNDKVRKIDLTPLERATQAMLEAASVQVGTPRPSDGPTLEQPYDDGASLEQPDLTQPIPRTNEATLCYDRIIDPGTEGDESDPSMPYVCMLPKGHTGEIHEHREDGQEVLARWVVKDGVRRFVTVVFTDTEEYQRFLGVPRTQEAMLGTNELADLVIRELMPLAHRIAKGRAKYANGCTVLSLLDEAGEVAHAVNKYESAERIREELLDVASVAMRLYFGEIDRGLEIDGLVQRRTDK